MEDFVLPDMTTISINVRHIESVNDYGADAEENPQSMITLTSGRQHVVMGDLETVSNAIRLTLMNR